MAAVKTKARATSKAKPKRKAPAKPAVKAKAGPKCAPRKAVTTTKAGKPKGLTIPQIKQKAKGLGITPGQMNKVDLVHAIQQAESYTPCFGTANGQCQNTECCFINDCR